MEKFSGGWLPVGGNASGISHKYQQHGSLGRVGGGGPVSTMSSEASNPVGDGAYNMCSWVGEVPCKACGGEVWEEDGSEGRDGGVCGEEGPLEERSRRVLVLCSSGKTCVAAESEAMGGVVAVKLGTRGDGRGGVWKVAGPGEGCGVPVDLEAAGLGKGLHGGVRKGERICESSACRECGGIAREEGSRQCDCSILERGQGGSGVGGLEISEQGLECGRRGGSHASTVSTIVPRGVGIDYDCRGGERGNIHIRVGLL